MAVWLRLWNFCLAAKVSKAHAMSTVKGTSRVVLTPPVLFLQIPVDFHKNACLIASNIGCRNGPYSICFSISSSILDSLYLFWNWILVIYIQLPISHVLDGRKYFGIRWSADYRPVYVVFIYCDVRQGTPDRRGTEKSCLFVRHLWYL